MRFGKRELHLRFGVIMGAFVLSLLMISCNQPAPQQRPGNAFSGSVHWARDIAQPLITNFATDAQLYNVTGAQIFSDGRLPANTGTWGLEAWSPGQQKVFQVVVRHDGTTSTNTRAQATAPSSDGQPIPQGWVNSTVVFNYVLQTNPKRKSE